MSRLVAVSNRLADPRKAAAGGLAVALSDALRTRGGLWFGWSGKKVVDGTPGEGELHVRQAGDVTLAGLDLAQDDVNDYYEGYSNGVLWPVFHYRLDLAEFEPRHLEGYRRVNRLFARKLMPLLRPDDLIWIHDYHLIPLASELRAMGCRNRMGFFLHVPLPPHQILAAVPQHEWLMRSLFAYDVIGLQSQTDVTHFSRYVLHESNAERLDEDRYRAFNGTVVVKAWPISIDVEDFQRLAQGREALDTFQAMRRQYRNRRLMVGVDRLDYSKGLPQRMRAFADLLKRYPENRGQTTLIQIASPSRENVSAYEALRHRMDMMCGAINGDYGELDWMPVRYIHRTLARKRIPGLYRAARVALVTPLRDGMNLVAKEYIASQDPGDPGVLVLSRFAGAAEQLTDALLVNPYDTAGTAEAMQSALQMPLQERQARHQRLMAVLRQRDIHWWFRSFLAALEQVPLDAEG